MFLRYVDPFAKACLPTYYNTYVNTMEYYESMNDLKRVVFNIIYRFIDIWMKSFEINTAANDSIFHFEESASAVDQTQVYVTYV